MNESESNRTRTYTRRQILAASSAVLAAPAFIRVRSAFAAEDRYYQIYSKDTPAGRGHAGFETIKYLQPTPDDLAGHDYFHVRNLYGSPFYNPYLVVRYPLYKTLKDCPRPASINDLPREYPPLFTAAYNPERDYSFLINYLTRRFIDIMGVNPSTGKVHKAKIKPLLPKDDERISYTINQEKIRKNMLKMSQTMASLLADNHISEEKYTTRLDMLVDRAPYLKMDFVEDKQRKQGEIPHWQKVRKTTYQFLQDNGITVRAVLPKFMDIQQDDKSWKQYPEYMGMLVLYPNITRPSPWRHQSRKPQPVSMTAINLIPTAHYYFNRDGNLIGVGLGDGRITVVTHADTQDHHVIPFASQLGELADSFYNEDRQIGVQNYLTRHIGAGISLLRRGLDMSYIKQAL